MTDKCTRCGKENPAEIHTCTPLALRLAEQLDQEQVRTVSLDIMHCKAAAELRRLYEVNAELVEALNWALDCLRFDPAERPMAHKFWIEAKAALKKAKGESNE